MTRQADTPDQHQTIIPQKTVVIVQARFGSTRLPGKVLKTLAGKTVLEHVLTRCRQIDGVDEVICATTDKAVDDPIAAEARRLNTTVFRGDEADVLSRYLGAARAANADVIMRVTSDCPLIDPAICAAVLALRQDKNTDYASNNMPRLFPHGLDCEAFTREALERAAIETTDPYDREHVTPWIRQAPDLIRYNLIGPGWPASAHRWTLDYPEDFTFFDGLFQRASEAELAHMQGVLSLLAQWPELTNLNAMHAVADSARKRPAIVFRFDADQRIGTGHAMRCATLSSRFAELGWPCYWAVMPETAAFLGNRLNPHQAIILSPSIDRHMSEIMEKAGDVFAIVLDHYGLPADFDRQAKSLARRVIWIDDFADRHLTADLIVNSTPAISARNYQSTDPVKTKLLLGGAAAPLRRQFSAQPAAASGSRKLDRIFISFGGVDPLDATSLAIEAIASILTKCQVDVAIGGNAPHLAHIRSVISQFDPSADRIRLYCDAAEIAGLMARADLCIGAPGTMTWERCCLAMPSLLIGIAENQRQNAVTTAAAGATIDCGFLTTQSRETVRAQLISHLHNLASDPSQLQRMSIAAAALCDGRGVDRIVIASQPPMPLPNGTTLQMRLAEPEDETVLLDWQRAPETRRFALNPAIPMPDEHHRWFTRKLRTSSDLLMIAEITGEPAGFIRLDWRGDYRGTPIYLISIATAPGHYRRGIGAGMLACARQMAPGAVLLAQILPANIASIGLFRALGYQQRPDGYYWSFPD